MQKCVLIRCHVSVKDLIIKHCQVLTMFSHSHPPHWPDGFLCNISFGISNLICSQEAEVRSEILRNDSRPSV